ncbi:MAG: LysR family transcriptional regulator [Lachnospiraceae bacterium]|nr:LysR family transcriptional regulator [Lachnospiraceae bacterium]
MDLRVLRYFLTVAEEESFIKAAERLHLTQPTLSRQLAALEEELGVKLFVRGSRKTTLMEEGVLLRRRALEICDMENKIIEEFKGDGDSIEGKITIGCGEIEAVETMADICKQFKEKYPNVQISFHTGTADVIAEMMNKGLVDVALFLEPVSTENLDYIRISNSDRWIVRMRPDDPLADKEYITKEDLIKLPLILPERSSVRSEIANWFGKDFGKLNVSFTINFGTNAAILAIHGLGYPITVESSAKYISSNVLVERPLYPKIENGSVIAWKRNIPYSKATLKFIETIKAFDLPSNE